MVLVNILLLISALGILKGAYLLLFLTQKMEGGKPDLHGKPTQKPKYSSTGDNYTNTHKGNTHPTKIKHT